MIFITKIFAVGHRVNSQLWLKSLIYIFCVFLTCSKLASADFIRASNLLTTLGTTSTTALTALSTKDQTSTTNDPTKYLQFNPVNLRYRGFFTFTIPTSLRANLNALALHANFRGPALATQQWLFRIFNHSTKLWVPVLDNTSVKTTAWTTLARVISGSPTSYLNSAGQVFIAYSTASSVASQLDFLALETLPKRWQPKIGLDWQVQFTGTINTALNVEAYDLDLFDTDATVINNLHANGKRVICYLSAGSYENWRPDANKFPAAVLGSNLDGWPGERWLDVRQLATLVPIMKARMQIAASKKCDAVDPDNMDGYTQNSGFSINYSQQLAYNKALAAEAHKLGLAISLKNNLEQIKDLVNDFDFAINESCLHYNECNMLTPFVKAGKPVLGLEYELTPSSFCPQVNTLNFDFLKKNSALDAARTACR